MEAYRSSLFRYSNLFSFKRYRNIDIFHVILLETAAKKNVFVDIAFGTSTEIAHARLIDRWELYVLLYF